MFNRIHFFNGFHNGDVHVSREFVKWIIKNVPAEEYVYSHNYSHKLIMDVDGLIFDNEIPLPKEDGWRIHNGTLYINTWFRTIVSIHNKYECSLQCLFHMFSESLAWLGIELPQDIEMFVPQIDYDRYEIGTAKKFMAKVEPFKKVFICNGNVLSGQSDNFDFNPIMYNLANKFKDTLFFLANGNNEVRLQNVAYTKDIIRVNENDLNENAYIAKFCPLIVGRASGPHAFCWNTDNTHKTVVDFAKGEMVGTFGLDKLYPQSFIHCSDFTNVEGVIGAEIRRIWKEE